MFLKSGDTVVSPWHDVPLHADAAKGLLNFICEIPKNTTAKARARAPAGATQRRGARCSGGRGTLATRSAALQTRSRAARRADGGCHRRAQHAHQAGYQEGQAARLPVSAPSALSAAHATPCAPFAWLQRADCGACALAGTTSTGTMACCRRPGRRVPPAAVASSRFARVRLRSRSGHRRALTPCRRLPPPRRAGPGAHQQGGWQRGGRQRPG